MKMNQGNAQAIKLIHGNNSVFLKVEVDVKTIYYEHYFEVG
jgi:hypothetical protein